MSEEKETRVDETNDIDRLPVSRRGVMRALGAAGGAGIVSGLGSPAAAASAPTASSEVEQITGKELGRLARTVAGHADVRNVMGPVMRETVRRGRIVEVAEHGTSNAVITRGPVKTAKANGTRRLAENDVHVNAARHVLVNGNEMVAVAIVTAEGQALTYYEYAEAENGVKQKAELWNIVEKEDDFDLSLEEASYNGALSQPVPKTSGDLVLAQSSDPCGGCHCSSRSDPDPGYELGTECAYSPDVLNCVMSTAGCAACKSCGSLYTCAACVLVFCSYALYVCCDGQEACVKCNCAGTR